MKYEVIDRITKEIVWRGANRATARRVADRRDLAYGAIRYLVRPA